MENSAASGGVPLRHRTAMRSACAHLLLRLTRRLSPPPKGPSTAFEPCGIVERLGKSFLGVSQRISGNLRVKSISGTKLNNKSVAFVGFELEYLFSEMRNKLISTTGVTNCRLLSLSDGDVVPSPDCSIHGPPGLQDRRGGGEELAIANRGNHLEHCLGGAGACPVCHCHPTAPSRRRMRTTAVVRSCSWDGGE